MSIEYFDVIPVEYFEERLTTMIDSGLTVLMTRAVYGIYDFLKIN